MHFNIGINKNENIFIFKAIDYHSEWIAMRNENKREMKRIRNFFLFKFDKTSFTHFRLNFEYKI